MDDDSKNGECRFFLGQGFPEKKRIGTDRDLKVEVSRMTRYNTFLLYAFVILVLARLILTYALVFSRSSQIQPWAELDGHRVLRGKGVTLLVNDRWVMGAVYGHLETGAIVIRTEDGAFIEIQPDDIQTTRIYDLS